VLSNYQTTKVPFTAFLKNVIIVFMYASVVLNLPIDKSFYYKIKPEHSDLSKGDRVTVYFGKRKLNGIVTGIYQSLNENIPENRMKFIESVFDKYFSLSEIQFELAKRIWIYYMSSFSQALHCVGGSLKNVKISFQKYDSPAENKILLNSDQNSAINKILNSDERVFLLHGVTGSGKTEVYFSIVEELIEKGFQTLFLLPEISLTPQNVKRFTDRFGKKVAIYNSSLSNGKKNYAVKSFSEGGADILIGTRSAVFLKAKKLGMIIIDEEHEYTYKQQETPFYDTRKIAVWRSELENCKVILGSATPSLESMKKAKDGLFELVCLSKRSDNRKMPDVEIVDMGANKKVTRNISLPLYQYMEKTIKDGNQILLLLNRRGFSTFVLCKSCHKPVKCKNCDISLNYHKKENILMCHYCGFKTRLPDKCSECDNSEFEYMGSGTERVEDELKLLFPDKKILRVDRDSSSKKDFYWNFYNDMNNKKIDIVIGTQMIGKGFDFPGVTCVGVLWADFILDFPDFRSPEKTAQLLLQVAGRAGRGSEGKVFIQTYAPEHYAVKCSINHNYDYFYGEEILRRKVMNFPPFGSLIRILFRGKNKELVEKDIEKFCKQIEEKIGKNNILGPAEAPVNFLRGFYRYHILIKMNHNRKALYELFKKSLENILNSEYRIDVDPVDML